MSSKAVSRATEQRGTKCTCQNEECGARFYDLNHQPIVCPICNTIYARVPATTVRPFQGPAHVDEVGHAEAHAAADGDARSQMQSEEEPAAGEDGVALIEDIEEDSADVSEIIDAPTEPEEKP